MLSLRDLLSNPNSLSEVDPGIWSAFALAVVLIVIAVKSRLNQQSIPEMAAEEPAEEPAAESNVRPLDCMVVIPARNEEEFIARAVKSLPHDTVIVVDDASEDGTAEAASQAGAGVIAAPKLLRGMVGKSNACAEGARLLTTKWILFADADTWYEPGFLESAIAAAEDSKVDFFSIYLKPVYESFGARMLAPYASALYFFGVNPRAGVAKAFNGQCVLVKREPYEFVGGHGAIHYLDEDLKLAALALRHRMKIGVGRASKLGRVTIDMESFERSAYRFGVGGSWVGVRVLLAALAFFLWIPASVWLLLEGHRHAAAAFALFPVFVLSFWYGPVLAILAPFGILGLTPKLFGAMLHVILGRRTKWKGRYI